MTRISEMDPAPVVEQNAAIAVDRPGAATTQRITLNQAVTAGLSGSVIDQDIVLAKSQEQPFDTTSINFGDVAIRGVILVQRSGLDENSTMRFWVKDPNGFFGTVLTLTNGGTGTKVGIGVSPSRVLEVGAGLGNMLCDGYDVHSGEEGKVDIQDLPSVAARLMRIPPKRWRRKPGVSLEEIERAVLADPEMARKWRAAIPEGHPAELRRIQDPELLGFVQRERDRIVAERSTQPEWQRIHYGPVAEDMGREFPEALNQNEAGEKSYSLSDLVGLLHGAVVELTDRLQAIESRLTAIESRLDVLEGGLR